MLAILLLISDIVITLVVTLTTKLYSYNLGWLFIILMFVLNYIILIGLFWLECIVETWFISYKKRPKERTRKYFQYKAKLIANFLLFLSNVSVKKINMQEYFGKDHLIIFNHSSSYDALILLNAVKGLNSFYIVKKELFKNPVGKIMFAAGSFGLDRDDVLEGARIIKSAAEEIKNNHHSVIVAPEGTRSHKQEINKMHPGTFKIAMYAKCDIVVLGIKNASNISKRVFFRHTRTSIEPLAILSYDKFKDASTTELKDEVENIYNDFLKQ